jgi:hypothetical protein
MKICPFGCLLFHADGHADLTKRIVVFPEFAKAPKECIVTQIISKPTLQQGALLASSCGRLLIQHCKTSICHL